MNMSDLMRWEPLRFEPVFKEFGSLARRFSNLFEGDLPEMELASGWHPFVDIYDEGTEMVLKAELPGMKKEDIHIEVQNNVLTLRGEKKREEKVEKEGFFRSERLYGSFSRSFTLPTTVDAEKIEASYVNGILTVKLPKVEAAKPKQIAVKAA
jgi:HSP20 family protein